MTEAHRRRPTDMPAKLESVDLDLDVDVDVDVEAEAISRPFRPP